MREPPTTRQPGLVRRDAARADDGLCGTCLSRACELMPGVGTSGPVWPAAGPAAMARRAGAKVAILNPDESEIDDQAHWRLGGTGAAAGPSGLTWALLRAVETPITLATTRGVPGCSAGGARPACSPGGARSALGTALPSLSLCLVETRSTGFIRNSTGRRRGGPH